MSGETRGQRRKPCPDARQFLRLRDRRGGSEGRQGTIPELHDLERSLEILLVKNADARPTDFWRTDYNDKGWNNMPVPGVWELNGYGDPST